MSRYLWVFLLVAWGPISWADCRGCCSHHGGVVCVDGRTRCADGTPLSVRCRGKGCNKCGGVRVEHPSPARHLLRMRWIRGGLLICQFQAPPNPGESAPIGYQVTLRRNGKRVAGMDDLWVVASRWPSNLEFSEDVLKRTGTYVLVVSYLRADGQVSSSPRIVPIPGRTDR